ncbi:hypothetical protein ACIP5Z_02310 [Rothia terrae]
MTSKILIALLAIIWTLGICGATQGYPAALAVPLLSTLSYAHHTRKSNQ